MAKVKVWYDKEGDFLEVTFREAKGHMKDIRDDIFERVDEKGKVTGFAIFNPDPTKISKSYAILHCML